ncbi:MAG: SurA N-terminal domain-containing protein [Saprospiraceae bacterium]
MALIGTIRKNSWLLVVLIALAMGGFILQSIVSGSAQYSAGSRNEMGKVNGEVISATQFSETESILYKNSGADNMYSNKANLWNYFKNKALVKSISEQIGLGVSTEELLDLEFGDNPSPIIVQRSQRPKYRSNK